MTVLGLLTTTYGAPSAREDLESLLLGVAAGDSHSLEELYHRTRTVVYGLVLSYLKHPQDAEDVTQDAFVRRCGTLPADTAGRASLWPGCSPWPGIWL